MTLRDAFVVGLAAAGLAGSAVPLHSQPAPAATLLIAAPAGRLAHALDVAFAEPFSQGGVDAIVVGTDGSIAGAQALHADVALLDAGALAAGCKSGSLRKLDWTALGGRERQVAGAASDCGEGAVLHSLILAWNRAKFSGQPGWAEFWDVAKVPGKRGLRRCAMGNLELALLADGVAPGDVYNTLRNDAGVQRAFRKLDQLKPYLVWWGAEAEAARLLETGEALMTSAPAATIFAAQRGEDGTAYPDFAVQWGGSLLRIDSLAILASGGNGTLAASGGNGTLAQRFLAFAADPKNQHGLPALGGFGGAATGSTDGLPAAIQDRSPSAAAHLSQSLAIDETFWQDNGPRLEKVYEAWLAK